MCPGLTAVELLMEIPLRNYKHRVVPRAAFRDIHRMLTSYKYSPWELKVISDWIRVIKEETNYREPKPKRQRVSF